jgi:hypothetical protein
MKKLILIVWGVLVVSAACAQRWDMGTNFNYTKPIGSMARNINQGFGITLEGARLLKNVPFSVGAEFSYNAYGHDRTRQQYTFDDGSITETDVIVTNSFSNLLLTGKFFLRKERMINPYFSAKVGYSWYRTTLTIEDPEDVDGCHPLESDRLLRDGTFMASGGAGMRVDFSSIFRKMKVNTLFFDLSAHMTQGGTVQYMNVDKKNPQQTPDSDVIAKFINNRTQVIHEHHVGYVYSSLVEMMEYRFGVIYRPNR